MARTNQPYDLPRPGRDAIDALTQLVNSMYDIELIRNAATFALIKGLASATITPGSGGQAVMTNKTSRPVAVYMRLQAPGNDLFAYLMYSTDQSKCTLTAGNVIHDAAPERTVIVPSGATLYVDVQTPAAGNQALAWAQFQLGAGKVGLLGEGV